MSHVHVKEGIAKALFVAAAGISILAVALICVFLFANGVPAIAQIGLPEFLFGTTWRPANDVYGIFPMIIGSIYVTAGRHGGGRARGASVRHLPLALRQRQGGARCSSRAWSFWRASRRWSTAFSAWWCIVPFIRDNMPGDGMLASGRRRAFWAS